jgi:hypothetical protein
VNGLLAAARTDQIPQMLPGNTTTPFRIGCSGSSPPDSFSTAVVDDVRIYDRALAQAEIASLAQ